MKVSKEFKIGLVVVAAIAAFIWGLSFLRGSEMFEGKNNLFALYPKIENLITGNPVQINGFKVGKIQKISLFKKNGNNFVLVKFLITEDVAIPKDSKAKIVSADLLGTKAVELIFSDKKEIVKNNDTLFADNEQGLKESFNAQLAPLQAKAEKLIGTIDSAFVVLNSMLNKKTRTNIDQTFESVRKTIINIENTTFKMNDLLGTEKPKITGLLNNLNNITANLDKSQDKINNAITNFSNLSDSLSKSRLNAAISNADRTMQELHELISRINSGQGTLGKMAKNDSLYNNFNKSAKDLDELLKDLKMNPKRYVHFSIFGRKDKNKPIN